MKTVKQSKKSLKKAKGAHLIEYGLVASLVGVATIAELTALGSKLGTLFAFIVSSIITTAS